MDVVAVCGDVCGGNEREEGKRKSLPARDTNLELAGRVIRGFPKDFCPQLANEI